MPDPISEIDVLLAAASQTDTDSVRLLFVARARCVFGEAKRRLENAEKLLLAQEHELERTIGKGTL